MTTPRRDGPEESPGGRRRGGPQQRVLHARRAAEDFGTPDPEATIVGQFDVSAQVDQMGIVLEKGSSLTACVDQALVLMKADGTLAQIYDTWISTGQSVPFFK